MQAEQITGLLGQGGIAAALIWVIYKVGMRLVAAIDGNTAKLDQHTKEDLASQAEVRNDLAAINAKLDTALDIGSIRGFTSNGRTGDR